MSDSSAATVIQSPQLSMGNLAPALYNHFSRNVSALELQTIDGVFGLVVTVQGIESPHIIRPKGASFNPKPARICQIIVAEYTSKRAKDLLNGSEHKIFLAALLSQLLTTKSIEQLKNYDSKIRGLDEISDAVWEVSLEASQLIKSELAVASQSDAEIILLSEKLDWLRHLHMSDQNLTQQMKFIEQLEKTVLPSIKFPSSNRLRELLNAGIARWQLKHS